MSSRPTSAARTAISAVSRSRISPTELGAILGPAQEVEAGELQLHLAGLQLRVIEDVVDKREEGLSAHVAHPGELRLLFGQGRVQQELGHPDDGVEGGPELVAHASEELALCRGRRLGGHERDLEIGRLAGHHEATRAGFDVHCLREHTGKFDSHLLCLIHAFRCRPRADDVTPIGRRHDAEQRQHRHEPSDEVVSSF